MGFKGKKHTNESKKKISEKSKGRLHTDKAKKKISDSKRGKSLSKETCLKISKSKKGKEKINSKKEKHWNWKGGKPKCPVCGIEIGRSSKACRKHSDKSALKGKKSPSYWLGKKHTQEYKDKMRESLLKRKFKHSEEFKKRISEMNKGEKSHLWRGGVTKPDRLERSKAEYKTWRKLVFERDNYTCVKCGQRGGVLNAHHKKQYAHHADVRLDINNGETLCEKCHRKVYVKRANSKIGDDVFMHEDNRRTIYDWYNAEFGMAKSNKVVFIEDTIPIGDHFHLNKDEIFFLVCGEFLEVVLGEKITYHIPAPYKIIVPRGTYHKFICSPGSILVGVATERFDPNDEIRKDA